MEANDPTLIDELVALRAFRDKTIVQIAAALNTETMEGRQRVMELLSAGESFDMSLAFDRVLAEVKRARVAAERLRRIADSSVTLAILEGRAE